MMKHALICVAASGLVLGCSSDDDSNQEGRAEASVSAQALIVNSEDVTGMRYVLQQVTCDDYLAPIGASITVDRVLEDQVIPGHLAELADEPLDEDSEHAFADLFKVVKAGCYNVTTIPLDDEGNPSEECAAAIKTGVEVEEGETTEVFLLNQCRGIDPGAVDAIAALNREPVLEDVWFVDSKFFCGSDGQICAAAADPDGDPLEFSLTLADEDAPCTVVAAPPGDGEQCWTLTCTESGQVDFNVSVYDLLHDEDDTLMRIEDWLIEEGYGSESHAELNAWAYVDTITLFADGDGDGWGGEMAEFCAGEDTDGHVPDGGDCDDTNPAVHPDAEEVCDDEVDDDCDGELTCPCVDPDTKMDIVLLQDLSGSFFDDIANVRNLVAPLHAAVNECVAEANFGTASFVDKPFSPFGWTGDYSYAFHSDLSPDLTALQTAVDNMVIRNGGDGAESQLTGLLHAALDPAFSWGDDTEKYIIVFTDFSNHVAGDCPVGAGCTAGPNNGDATLNEREDYPAYAQVATALDALGIKVVFASSGFTGHYTGVLSTLGVDGSVVPLSSDSSNLLDAVLTGVQCQCEE